MWLYREADNIEAKAVFNTSGCMFCETKLLKEEEEEIEVFAEGLNYGFSDGLRTNFIPDIGICPACGWWKYSILRSWANGEEEWKSEYGVLKKLDITDMSIPIREVRSYLLAKFDSIFDIDPKRFEDVVSSVFGDIGYKSQVTAYTGDGGIDVILYDSSGKSIGVQVKRYKNSINVEQIRALTGALVIGGFTKGVFVTTSSFQSGVPATARLSEIKGYPIELMDSIRFYQVLKIAQINSYRDNGYPKPWGNKGKFFSSHFGFKRE